MNKDTDELVFFGMPDDEFQTTLPRYTVTWPPALTTTNHVTWVAVLDANAISWDEQPWWKKLWLTLTRNKPQLSRWTGTVGRINRDEWEKLAANPHEAEPPKSWLDSYLLTGEAGQPVTITLNGSEHDIIRVLEALEVAGYETERLSRTSEVSPFSYARVATSDKPNPNALVWHDPQTVEPGHTAKLAQSDVELTDKGC